MLIMAHPLPMGLADVSISYDLIFFEVSEQSNYDVTGRCLGQWPAETFFRILYLLYMCSTRTRPMPPAFLGGHVPIRRDPSYHPFMRVSTLAHLHVCTLAH